MSLYAGGLEWRVGGGPFVHSHCFMVMLWNDVVWGRWFVFSWDFYSFADSLAAKLFWECNLGIFRGAPWCPRGGKR